MIIAGRARFRVVYPEGDIGVGAVIRVTIHGDVFVGQRKRRKGFQILPECGIIRIRNSVRVQISDHNPAQKQIVLHKGTAVTCHIGQTVFSGQVNQEIADGGGAFGSTAAA